MKRFPQPPVDYLKFQMRQYCQEDHCTKVALQVLLLQANQTQQDILRILLQGILLLAVPVPWTLQPQLLKAAPQIALFPETGHDMVLRVQARRLVV